MKEFRPVATPLLCNDPFFNVYSFANNLYDDTTRHWTGVRQYLIGAISIDGEVFEFLGKVNPDSRRYFTGYKKIKQIKCEVKPLSTKYIFENRKIRLTLIFTSPLVLDNLSLLSRPVSYISYKLEVLDNVKHKFHLYFGFSSEFCVNNLDQEVRFNKTDYSYYFTSGKENMLKRHGDDHRIEWGEFHVSVPNNYSVCATTLRNFQYKIRTDNLNLTEPINYQDYEGPNHENYGPNKININERFIVGEYLPCIKAECEFVCSKTYSNHITLLYNDYKSIQYFEKNLNAYWHKYYKNFDEMAKDSIDNYKAIMKKVNTYENKLINDFSKYSKEYYDILCLAYRQTVSAHKLVYDSKSLLFLSKENYSNGCVATVDITYPSMPLFLIYNNDLVEGMLNPIYHYVESGNWKYEFAPHDIGRYPLANKQIYGYDERYLKKKPNPLDWQMPVEECGNMLICTVVLCIKRNNYDYFIKHKKVLKQWADYLVDVGYDPDNQLCTDDFAGHLAHNCNLSVKAICALKLYANALEKIGNIKDSIYYSNKAKEYAIQWEDAAYNGTCYSLSFDKKDSWSIKYNMIWDKVLCLNLFSKEVYEREYKCYIKHINKYGIPLDSRADYTKTDWQIWAASMFKDDKLFNEVVERMHVFINNTEDRVPFTDLYFTSKPIQRGFQARSVQGGLFIKLLNFDQGGHNDK